VTHSLEGLFRAKSLAIFGASDKNPWGMIAYKTMRDVGFDGAVHLVNRRGTPALGQQTIMSCKDAEGGIDAAFVAAPAAFMIDAVEDMAAAGVRYGAAVTSGFAETGAEGAAEQQKIFDRARALGVTLLGPNSLGFTNFVDRIALGAMPVPPPILDNPRVGLVSQSGATTVLIAQIAQQQSVSLTHMVAMGNEAMVDLADVIDFLVDDKDTKAICVFAESIRNPESFLDAARAAHEARKPIVMLKVGVGELTAAVAQAHTGALVGNDRVFQAMCDAYNIVRVDSMEDLVITADMLAATGPVDTNKGFALVSISGGACEIVADRGEEVGIPFPQFNKKTLEKLSGVISDFGAAHNPLDITGAAMSQPSLYSNVLKILGDADDFGFVGVIGEIPTSEKLKSPVADGASHEMGVGFAASGLKGCIIQQVLKPVSDYGRRHIEEHNLPLVTGGIDHAVRAIGHLFAWSLRIEKDAPQTAESSKSPPKKLSGETETLSWLGGQNVPVIPQTIVNSREEAAAFANKVGAPVVLKILSPDIQHKTEVGGVKINIDGGEAAGAAYDEIIESVKAKKPNARVEGAIISPMRTGGQELIVGVTRDPSWGLSLTVGMGGVWVELLKDAQMRLLPLEEINIKEMLETLKAAKLLKGYRGSKPANLEKLSSVIANIGRAAAQLGDDLQALEINPLRVDGDEIEALDALAVWSDA
jgi:acetate---CoA ligase (ADP-forming)